MSNVYCGIKKVPKGKTMGTMKECHELGQVRHWGKEVDADYIKQLEDIEKIKEDEKNKKIEERKQKKADKDREKKRTKRKDKRTENKDSKK